MLNRRRRVHTAWRYAPVVRSSQGYRSDRRVDQRKCTGRECHWRRRGLAGSSLGLILHAGHAARHGALPCAPRTHGGVHPCTAGVGGIDRRVHVTRENTKDRFAKYSVAVNPTHAPRATTVSFPSAIVGRATVRLYLIVHTAYEALFSARARGGGRRVSERENKMEFRERIVTKRG